MLISLSNIDLQQIHYQLQQHKHINLERKGSFSGIKEHECTKECNIISTSILKHPLIKFLVNFIISIDVFSSPIGRIYVWKKIFRSKMNYERKVEMYKKKYHILHLPRINLLIGFIFSINKSDLVTPPRSK